MNHETNHQDHERTNGVDHGGEARARRDDAGSRAAAALDPRKLVLRVERELRQHPLRTLSFAAGIGMGAGVLLASRIARVLLITAGSYAAKEFLRGRVKAFLAGT